MRARRPVGMTLLGAAWIGSLLSGMAGCDAGAPPAGSRAAVTTDHLEKQRARLEQFRAGMKTRPSSGSSVRR